MAKIITFSLLFLSLSSSAKSMKLSKELFTLLGVSHSSDFLVVETELGFINKKKSIDAYISFFLHNSDLKDSHSDAAALGAKGGVMFPLLKNYGFAPHIGAGWGRSNKDTDPWFGDRDDAERKQFFLLETGSFFYYKDIIAKVNYRLTTLNYISSNLSFLVGINFD